ncbi:MULTISPECIES: hypothetical protein [unclassified Pseudomonas]|uniref:hypothetical protein n=1 Tax=unclassified Pseudomonas TaxID=196821 RepID=UPI00142FC8F0|nr:MULTISPECIES: hypothetical protein [unclassified Pseudomonas]
MSRLWEEHCPASLGQDEAWKMMGLTRALSGFAAAVYLNLGIRRGDGFEQIEGVV